MSFRNPIYLNAELLSNLADYYGVDLPGEAQVTRRSLDERRGRAGINRGIDIGREKDSIDEVTEVYSTQARPVRAMNDVIDTLVMNGTLVDLVADPSHAVAQRDVVQLEGSLSLSPVTEIGAVMSALIPLMIDSAMKPGATAQDVDPLMVAQLIMSGKPKEGFLNVLEVDSDIPEMGVYVLTDPAHLFGSATMEDLDGELTLLGTVDRLVSTGASFSLERHLLPGMNRTARRALQAKGGIESMLQSFGKFLGRDLDASSLSIMGPALVVTAVTVF